MTTEITPMEPVESTSAAASLAEATTPQTPPAEPDAAAAPAPVKAKPITWETDRNAAAAALVRAGATPREARVLASLGAQAAAALRQNARKDAPDSTKLDDKAAESVLAEHRAAASPTWNV